MAPMDTASKFSGARIRQARHAAGLTQAALAVAAGTRERNIIRWENDQHSPRFEHVAAIAKATGKEIEFFAAEAVVENEDDEESDLAAFLINALRSYQQKPKAERQTVKA